ncbi:hypothetical protein LCGC14_0498750 [marine sediment metagenome]|uniref:Uncharacterized protein n=1 Tax=marine sediment metagenome TaxID=412755 RepID=A0A0F9URK5_9ZZZZ
MTTLTKPVYHVWRGEYRPQGTPERPYAYTEQYILVRGQRVVLTAQVKARIEAQGGTLYYPVRG